MRNKHCNCDWLLVLVGIALIYLFYYHLGTFLVDWHLNEVTKDMQKTWQPKMIFIQLLFL